MKRFSILTLFLCIMCSGTFAHDFLVKVKGQNLYFNITSHEKKTVELTYGGNITNPMPAYAGDLVIPSLVDFKDVTYSVASIGRKAFAGDTKLTSVEMPATIRRIEDFAFEGCIALQRILFPAEQVSFGQGSFFGCTAIKEVALGSDWTSVDFTLFRWSKQLETVNLPAKIKNVGGLKKLTALKTISVDPVNVTYRAADGLLYSSDNRLLSCPRAKKGSVTLVTETKSVAIGAFASCNMVDEVVLPSNLTFFSFREFAQMKALKRVVCKATEPILNAKDKDGKKFFLIQLSDPKSVEVDVPKSAVKKYKDVIASEGGEYTNTANDKTPYVVPTSQIVTKKQLKGVKNL